MLDILFFIVIFIAIMSGQIAVELLKSYIKIKTSKAQVSAAIDTVFVKLGNAALQKALSRKGDGPNEM